MKIKVVNLTKWVQDLYIENYMCSWIITVNMTILPEVLYRFNRQSLSKSQQDCLSTLENFIVKFILKCRSLRIVKTIIVFKSPNLETTNISYTNKWVNCGILT